jgi:uracil-DNA glycosylase family 4
MTPIDNQQAKKLASAGGDDKSGGYDELVNARKTCNICAGLTNASAIESGIYDCNEIGSWSLWQGNLNTQVMVVGQDWGDVNWFLRAEGRPTSTSTTNKTLVELLHIAGLEINLFNKTVGRGLLFFTNAILCMKKGGAQASVKAIWSRNCATLFLRPLIELVRPKVVICLGAKAYGAVMAAYKLKTRGFRTAVDSGKPDLLSAGVYVFPVYHCGAYVLNTHRRMLAQKLDWQRIGAFLSQGVA